MFPFPIVAPARVTPDAFSFTGVSNVAIGTLVTSGSVTPTGYDTAVFASADNGAEISIAGGAWSSVPQLISPGQAIQVRMTSSAGWSTAKTTTVSIGGRTATWTVTTGTVAGGAWDTGWTAGSWAYTTPTFFNWVRVQLWGPGGGGGGGAGSGEGLPPGQDGADGGYAQFAGGPYVTGGGRGTGGRSASIASPIDGYTTSHGTGYGGDVVTAGGGAPGGAGGPHWSSSGYRGGAGGAGGAGGYLSKTYSWGQIAAATAYSVVVQGPGGGGAPGAPLPAGPQGEGAGAAGSYGRAYIDWG